MANTTCITNTFRNEILTTGFNLTSKSFKAALYFASATVNATTAAYTTTGEATGTGYTAGGAAVTNGTAVTGANSTVTGDTYYWTPSANIAWTTVTIAAFDSVMIYDANTPFHPVGIWNFGTQTVTAGNITLTMPANAAGTALVRLL
jgi:hypothetical protein